jgi:heat shock protein HtpX
MALLITAVGWAVGFLLDPSLGNFGAILFAFVGVILWAYVQTSGHKAVLQISRARRATQEEDRMLTNVGEEIAIAAGIPLPTLYVIEDSSPNAFATGLDPRSGIICVTTGLLEKLDRDELQGVVAHEMAHIRNNDIRLMTTLALTVGLFVLLRDLFLRGWLRGGGGRNRKGEGNAILLALAIALVILAPVFAVLLHLAVSRQREFLADATAVQFTRYPDGLARALEKIANDPDELEAANKATEHMYIVSPFQKLHDRSNLFSTHPPIRERIRRLRAMGIEKRHEALREPPALQEEPRSATEDTP